MSSTCLSTESRPGLFDGGGGKDVKELVFQFPKLATYLKVRVPAPTTPPILARGLDVEPPW